MLMVQANTTPERIVECPGVNNEAGSGGDKTKRGGGGQREGGKTGLRTADGVEAASQSGSCKQPDMDPEAHTGVARTTLDEVQSGRKGTVKNEEDAQNDERNNCLHREWGVNLCHCETSDHRGDLSGAPGYPVVACYCFHVYRQTWV